MTVQKDVIDEESKPENLVSDRCLSELDPEDSLLSNFRNLGVASSCRELLFSSPRGFLSTIPKHITTLDEKYVLGCLELIRDYALRAEAWSVASKAPILPNDFTDLAYLANECSLVSRTEKFGNSSVESTLGSITDSPSMINILKSPLLRQLGFDPNSGTADFRHKSIDSLLQSPKEAAVFAGRRDLIAPSRSPSSVHRRVVSMSSTNSSCSERSSSSVSAASFQGMLQCTWNDDGLPHHVFSVDDKREVYVADSCKMDSISGDKGLDCIYTFRLGKMAEKESDSVAAVMRVSSSISFGPKGLEIKETRYILSAPDDEKPMLPPQAPNVSNRKKKRSSIRRPSYMQKSFSKLSNSISEDTPWDPSSDAGSRIDYAPNHELAAIVIKDVLKNHQEPETGGWGLRFLKKSRNVSESSTDECSTSTNILIPAGLHGGPKTRGPSSLIERWISGGQCDCGGWDTGCPLTILITDLNALTKPSQPDNSSRQCKSVDIFIKGSKQDAAALKMVNIHNGLFYIHFQPSLSSLQAFAIAAALLHSRSSLL